MSIACRLLESTSARVKEVAAELGYHDPYYFSRVFKAVHNRPPSHYKAGRSGFTVVTNNPVNTNEVIATSKLMSMAGEIHR
jgi:AraC-like DNA-binding protein